MWHIEDIFDMYIFVRASYNSGDTIIKLIH